MRPIVKNFPYQLLHSKARKKIKIENSRQKKYTPFIAANRRSRKCVLPRKERSKIQNTGMLGHERCRKKKSKSSTWSAEVKKMREQKWKNDFKKNLGLFLEEEDS